jgi:hypothetical protein
MPVEIDNLVPAEEFQKGLDKYPLAAQKGLRAYRGYQEFGSRGLLPQCSRL